MHTCSATHANMKDYSLKIGHTLPLNPHLPTIDIYVSVAQ